MKLKTTKIKKQTKSITEKQTQNSEREIIECELISQIKKVNRTHPKNETYDYILAKYFSESNGNIPFDGLAVRDIENFIGMRISDGAMCNKLICYWITFCDKKDRVIKARNIIELIESPTERLIIFNEEMIKMQKMFFNQLYNLNSKTDGKN